MKSQFLKRLLLFTFVYFVALNMVCQLLINMNWHKAFIENGQIYNAISKSRQEAPNMDVVLIGGSVANQMYNNETYNGAINSFCTVMPITIAGQYLILKSILEHNDLSGKHVTMIMHPNGFKATLQGPSLYHYFLKPFYNREFRPLMDPCLNQELSTIRAKWLYQIPIIRCSNWTPKIEDSKVHHTGKMLSQLSVTYLLEISALAQKHGFSFRILSPVQPKKNMDIDYTAFKAEIQINGLHSAFEHYFESMQYLEDILFIDGYHLKDASGLGQIKENIQTYL